MPQEPAGPRTNWRLLQCGQCGRTETPSAADVAGYSRSGWPKCCGQVMSYTSEADARFSPETPIETPGQATTTIPGRAPRVHLSVLVVDDHLDAAVSQASLLRPPGSTFGSRATGRRPSPWPANSGPT